MLLSRVLKVRLSGRCPAGADRGGQRLRFCGSEHSARAGPATVLPRSADTLSQA